MEIFVTHIDTACMLLEINGYKILTDPTLDLPGKLYHHGFGVFSRKTSAPTINTDQIQDIDLILLSHHQHKDNFDDQGRAFTKTVSTVVSTKAAAKAMPGVIGLAEWQTVELNTEKLPGLLITATPAQHRPGWVPEFLSGKVIGFMIGFDGQTDGSIYISGDTVYFDGIKEIAQRFTIDIAFFHVGSVQIRYLTAFARYTMNAGDFIKSATTLTPRCIVPLHYKGWSHFKEDDNHLKKEISAYPLIKSKTLFVPPGQKTRLK